MSNGTRYFDGGFGASTACPGIVTGLVLLLSVAGAGEAQVNDPPRLVGLDRTLMVQGGAGRLHQNRLFALVDSLLTEAGFARAEERAVLVAMVQVGPAQNDLVTVSIAVRLDERVDRHLPPAERRTIMASTWQRGEVRSVAVDELQSEVEAALVFWITRFIEDVRRANGAGR